MLCPQKLRATKTQFPSEQVAVGQKFKNTFPQIAVSLSAQASDYHNNACTTTASQDRLPYSASLFFLM
jgi:hypothetical protein